MSSAFITGLFGSEVSPLYPKAAIDAKRTIQNNYHPPGMKYYVFGRNNYDLLKSVGQEATLLDENPLRNWLNMPLDPQPCGQIFHGLRMWIHKLDIIYRALDEYDEVTWLDFDVIPTAAGVPEDYWDRMRKGQEFQMSMVRLKQPVCSWRRDPVFGDGSHYRPHGGFLYCRNKAIMWQLMILCLVTPSFSDEDVAGIWCDMQIGPVTPETVGTWKQLGYEPYCYRHRAQLFSPEQVMFFHHRIKEG